jgi:hypothetical protein
MFFAGITALSAINLIVFHHPQSTPYDPYNNDFNDAMNGLPPLLWSPSSSSKIPKSNKNDTTRTAAKWNPHRIHDDTTKENHPSSVVLLSQEQDDVEVRRPHRRRTTMPTMDDTHVIKVAILSPKKGYVMAFGTKDHFCSNDDGLLSSSNNSDKDPIYTLQYGPFTMEGKRTQPPAPNTEENSSSHQTLEQLTTMELYWKNTGQRFLPVHDPDKGMESVDVDTANGNLLIFHFFVGQDLWQQALTLQSSQILVDFIDLLQSNRTVQNVPLLVDPSLIPSNRRKKHFLSAMTTVRRGTAAFMAKLQNMTNTISASANSTSMTTNASVDPRKRRKHKNDKNNPNQVDKYQAQLYETAWSDQDTLTRLEAWLRHHQALGIEHFYIIDNEWNESKPDLLSLPKQPTMNPGLLATAFAAGNITYIRTNQSVGYPVPCKPPPEEKKGKLMRGKHPASFNRAGQMILENAVLFAANTEWMLSTDFDEFVTVSRKEPFQHNLGALVKHYYHHYRSGKWGKRDDVNGPPLVVPSAISFPPFFPCSVDYASINFPMQGLPSFINNTNSLRLKPQHISHQKVVLKPDAVRFFRVHYPRLLFPNKHKLVEVQTEDGFLAHLRVGKSKCSKQNRTNITTIEHDYVQAMRMSGLIGSGFRPH